MKTRDAEASLEPQPLDHICHAGIEKLLHHRVAGSVGAAEHPFAIECARLVGAEQPCAAGGRLFAAWQVGDATKREGFAAGGVVGRQADLLGRRRRGRRLPPRVSTNLETGKLVDWFEQHGAGRLVAAIAIHEWAANAKYLALFPRRAQCETAIGQSARRRPMRRSRDDCV
jgi:hypothetical protein